MMTAMSDKDLADHRSELHKGQRSQRILTKNYERLGIKGERTFSDWSGLTMDTTDRIQGDRGIDFTAAGYTIDVKTASHDYGLWVEKGKARADIFVLCVIDELIGWCWQEMLLTAPLKVSGYGITNYVLRSQKLKPMATLERIING